ncbi:hypothetical protein DL93DRAFT_2165398 [Clavulina sp. PMI_390]|nr:hypothetical protein DL93DRAFT_2165398 [Clavulina sp. PMI_390]
MMQRAVVRAAAARRIANVSVAGRRWTSNDGVGRENQSKGFSQKEKAQEDLYIYEKEKAKAKDLEAGIKKKEAELKDVKENISKKEQK